MRKDSIRRYPSRWCDGWNWLATWPALWKKIQEQPFVAVDMSILIRITQTFLTRTIVFLKMKKISSLDPGKPGFFFHYQCSLGHVKTGHSQFPLLHFSHFFMHHKVETKLLKGSAENVQIAHRQPLGYLLSVSSSPVSHSRERKTQTPGTTLMGTAQVQKRSQWTKSWNGVDIYKTILVRDCQKEPKMVDLSNTSRTENLKGDWQSDGRVWAQGARHGTSLPCVL